VERLPAETRDPGRVAAASSRSSVTERPTNLLTGQRVPDADLHNSTITGELSLLYTLR